MWPRSASKPSLTSVMAVAPAPAACGPAAYGGCGTRCASTAALGDRKPRLSAANPAPARPSCPAYATTSPGSAPERSTGRTASPIAVTAMTILSDAVTSPPTMCAPTWAHSTSNPRVISSTHDTGRSAGAPNPTVRAVATPPIALMSERLHAAALRPMSCGDDQSRRKWRPSTSRSVETTKVPSLVETWAASSPGPSRTWRLAPIWARTWSIRPNSPMSPIVGSSGALVAIRAIVSQAAAHVTSRIG